MLFVVVVCCCLLLLLLSSLLLLLLLLLLCSHDINHPNLISEGVLCVPGILNNLTILHTHKRVMSIHNISQDIYHHSASHLTPVLVLHLLHVQLKLFAHYYIHPMQKEMKELINKEIKNKSHAAHNTTT